MLLLAVFGDWLGRWKATFREFRFPVLVVLRFLASAEMRAICEEALEEWEKVLRGLRAGVCKRHGEVEGRT
jgi:hypothetical protein